MHEQPPSDLVESDGNPEELTATLHQYRGHVRADFLDRYVEHHGQRGRVGIVDDGDDARRTHGVALLRQLWQCLEIVLPGDLVPPRKEHHADSTDLVFSHDACTSPGVTDGRWAGVHKPGNYFVVFASHRADDDPWLVACRDGQARRRKGLWELRTIVEEHLDEHPDDHRIAWTCCDPPIHPATLSPE